MDELLYKKSVVREYFESLVIAAIFALFIRTFVIQFSQIPTGSMEDNLLVGDHIIYNRSIYAPKAFPFENYIIPTSEIRRDDVIVFKFPEDLSKDFIKRVIAIPGDTIEIRDKVVYLNGKKVEETFVYHKDSKIYRKNFNYPPSLIQRDNMPLFTVPEDSYFVMGDNRDNSHDSRYWGVVSRKYIKGRALLIYWSFETRSGSHIYRGLLPKLKQLGETVWYFFVRTRWERTFKLIH